MSHLQILIPSIVLHSMANFRGMKPLHIWSSSRPWDEVVYSFSLLIIKKFRIIYRLIFLGRFILLWLFILSCFSTILFPFSFFLIYNWSSSLMKDLKINASMKMKINYYTLKYFISDSVISFIILLFHFFLSIPSITIQDRGTHTHTHTHTIIKSTTHK